MPTATETRVFRDLTVRSFEVRADSWRDQDRSFEAVLATEAPVVVFDMSRWEPVEEVLLMKGCRLPARGQLPLLDSHDRTSIRDGQIGSVRELRIDPDRLVGRCFLSAAEAGIATKVKEGHVTDCSVGYQVRNSVTIEPGQTVEVEGRKFTAGPTRALRVTTDWAVKENSLCPIGADEGAKVREPFDVAHGPELVEGKPAGGLPAQRKEGPMPPESTPVPAGASATPPAASAAAPVAQPAPTPEIRELPEENLARRVMAITPHELVPVAQEHLLKGETFEQCRAAVLEAFAKGKQEPAGSTEPDAAHRAAAPAAPKVADIPAATLIESLLG